MGNQARSNNYTGKAALVQLRVGRTTQRRVERGLRVCPQLYVDRARLLEHMLWS